jgi:predicted  nucleic acid-binding Zn-ribbon protein
MITKLPFQCLECGKGFNEKGAAKAMWSGCPNCNGLDIDLNRGIPYVKGD